MYAISKPILLKDEAAWSFVGACKLPRPAAGPAEAVAGTLLLCIVSVVVHRTAQKSPLPAAEPWGVGLGLVAAKSSRPLMKWS